MRFVSWLYVAWFLYTNTSTCEGVDGGWSSWISFPCSKSCGGGAQMKTRFCTNPSPSLFGGKQCRELNGSRGLIETITVACNTRGCPVNGGWSRWGSYSSCSKTCGGGVKSKRRSCANPRPSNGGLSCLMMNGKRGLSETFTLSCYTRSCPPPVNGGWSRWGPYSLCSRTCGNGVKSKNRTCTNPLPSNGGRYCTVNGRISFSQTSTSSCNLQSCSSAVQGGWSNWSSYTKCSTTCGVGYKSKSRTCTHPRPSNNGQVCLMRNGTRDHSETSTSSCNTGSCSRPEGKWGRWTYSHCSSTCYRTKTRICNSQSKTRQQCIRSDGTMNTYETMTESCNQNSCTEGGEWSRWASSSCSRTCGGGYRTKTRTCNSLSHQCVKGYMGMNENITESCNSNLCTEIKPVAIGKDGSVTFVVPLPVFRDIRTYDVIVTELGETEKFPREDPGGYTVNEIKRNVDGLYVAERVTDPNRFGKEVVIGGKRRQRRSLPAVENKPLKNNTYYGIFVRGYVDSDTFYTSKWYPPVKNEVKKVSKVGETIIIIVAIIAVLIIIAIVIIVIICCRKKQRPRPPQPREVPARQNKAFEPVMPTAPLPSYKRPAEPVESNPYAMYQQIDYSTAAGVRQYDPINFNQGHPRPAVIPPRPPDMHQRPPNPMSYTTRPDDTYEQAIDQSKDHYDGVLNIPLSGGGVSAGFYEQPNFQHSESYAHLGVTVARPEQSEQHYRDVAPLESDYDNNMLPNNPPDYVELQKESANTSPRPHLPESGKDDTPDYFVIEHDDNRPRDHNQNGASTASPPPSNAVFGDESPPDYFTLESDYTRLGGDGDYVDSTYQALS